MKRTPVSGEKELHGGLHSYIQSSFSLFSLSKRMIFNRNNGCKTFAPILHPSFSFLFFGDAITQFDVAVVSVPLWMWLPFHLPCVGKVVTDVFELACINSRHARAAM